MILDFTTTAVSRPEIVNRTYKTFSRKLKGVEFDKCTLYINIDPLPVKADRNEVVEVAKKYFGKVVPNMPSTPNFTAAYNWIWNNATSDYIFNLEDDWELNQDVNINDMMKFFSDSPSLYQVVLRAYKYKYESCPLSPSILHKRFYKSIAGKLDESLNPEIQLRGSAFGLEMPNKTFSVKGKLSIYSKSVIVKDIGTEWRNATKFKKPKKKGRFVSWE